MTREDMIQAISLYMAPRAIAERLVNAFEAKIRESERKKIARDLGAPR